MSGGFKRSGLFGVIGVVVVAVLVAVIALATEGNGNPKLTLGLVFAVIGLFCVVLFVLQRSDLNRVSGRDAASSSRAAAEGGRGQQVENPTTLAEPELWAAMATAPIDADAVRARDEMWGVARGSQNLAIVVTILIFLTVPAIYLLESFLPLLVGGPLIVGAALYGSFRAIGPGGAIEQSYALTDRAMAPLGLAVTDRPDGGLEMRLGMPGFDYRLRGWTVLSGERHGRTVVVRIGGHEDAGTSEVLVAEPSHEWSAESRRVEVQSGPEGVLVRRRKGEPRDWLCDLWLAEHLATAPTR